MFATTYQAKYVTKQTAKKYGFFDRLYEESSSAIDFGYALKEREKWVEVIDPETNEVVDIGHFILLTNSNGDKFANILYCERESILVTGDNKEDWDSTIFSNVEVRGFPPH